MTVLPSGEHDSLIIEHLRIDESMEHVANPLEDQLWLLYQEIGSIVPKEQQSFLHTELILYHIQTGKTDIACYLISGALHEDKQGELAGSLTFTDKLRIFREAASNGEFNVLAELGDMRTEAEEKGPEAIGLYLLEEIRQGWNVHANLEAVSAIYEHTQKPAIRKSGVFGELIVKIYEEEGIASVEAMLAYFKELNLPFPASTMLFISAHRREAKLKKLTPRVFTDARYKAPSTARNKGSLVYQSRGGRYTRTAHRRTEKRFPELATYDTASLQGVDALLLLVLDEKYRKDVFASRPQAADRVKAQYDAATTGVRTFIDAFYPDVVEQLRDGSLRTLRDWHKKFMSPDARPEQRRGYYSDKGKIKYNYPVNVMFLDKLSTGQLQAVLQNVASLATKPHETDTHDDRGMALFGEIDLVEQDIIDIERSTDTSRDSLDQLRLQNKLNAFIANYTSLAMKLPSARQRLDVLLKLGEIVEDREISDVLRQNLKKRSIEVVDACLASPLDRLAYGEIRLRQLREVLTGEASNLALLSGVAKKELPN